jgi:GNAT superfamily N-acetyltransferase
MLSLKNIKRLDRSDVDRAAGVLARAFPEDPEMMYMFGKEPEYDKKLFLFFRMILRHGIVYGEAYATSPKMEGVAVWNDSGKGGMDAAGFKPLGMDELCSQILPETMERITRLSEGYAERKKICVPCRHWFLAFTGVDPAYRGMGFSSMLIKPMLARIDGEKVPCYLETCAEGNVPLYEHLGFKKLKAVKTPGSDLIAYPMVRN